MLSATGNEGKKKRRATHRSEKKASHYPRIVIGQGLDIRKLAWYKRAINKAAGRNGGRPLQEWQQLLSIVLARNTAATVLPTTGHKALRGT